MNKIKELWRKNKILWVLLLILLICFIAIVVVVVTFFFGGSKSVYGDRLNGIDDYPITENFISEYETELESEELVNDAEVKTKGRVVYITIDFLGDTTLVEAQSKAASSLEKFSEKILYYYDIQFTLLSDATENSDGFTIMGARNANGTGVVWNNNTKVESEE